MPFQALANHRIEPAPTEAPAPDRVAVAVQAAAAEPEFGEEDDAAILQRAFRDVRRLDPQKARVVAKRVLSLPLPRVQDAQALEDAEALASLADLVSGDGDFQLDDTVEWVEGIGQGVDRRLLQRLKQGDYPLQGDLDLHGESKGSALLKVTRFFKQARGGGQRCVLIVHGRGLRSPGGIPVLKEALCRWLSGDELSRHVLCFCTALPSDGGPGSIYVLLRK